MIMKLDYNFAPFVLFLCGRVKKNYFPYISSDVTDGLTSLQLIKKYRK